MNEVTSVFTQDCAVLFLRIARGPVCRFLMHFMLCSNFIKLFMHALSSLINTEKKAEVIERLTGEMLKCDKARSVWNMPFKTALLFLSS